MKIYTVNMESLDKRIQTLEVDTINAALAGDHALEFDCRARVSELKLLREELLQQK